MMKNLILVQALILSSIHTTAGEKPFNGLRGANAESEAVPQGDRSLKGMGMGMGMSRAYYSDDDYYSSDSNSGGKCNAIFLKLLTEHDRTFSLEGCNSHKEFILSGKGKGKGKNKGKGKGKGMGKGMGKGKGRGNGGYSTPEPSDYYSDDAYYGKGKGKGKGTNVLYPNAGDINFLDDNYFDDKFFEDDDCELVTLNETFTVPRASRFLAPDTTPVDMGDPTLIGTVFIWENQQIFEPNGEVPIIGTRVSGTCTRTTEDDEGMGSCQLVFVDDDEYTINVGGVLTGPFGSSLSITGGTGGMVGVIGEMDFFPIYNLGEFDGDIFINITRYEVEADLGLIVCPTTH
jgi:hypothetical protein